jgi:hypothetical protein
MQDWSEIYFIPTRNVPQLAVSFHSVFELAERPTVTIVWQLWTFMVKTLGRVAWQKQLLKIYNITTNILKWIIFHFLYSFQNSDKPTRHKLSNETFYDKLRKTKILNICLSDEIWLHGMISYHLRHRLTSEASILVMTVFPIEHDILNKYCKNPLGY